MNRPIALLTDFGLTDHYVGSIKSVIFSINPKAVVYDLTHDVRPQNIREGAFILSVVYSVLPENSIVVAVVDPGVGSERQALCIKTKKAILIGPDNGLLSLAIKDEKYETRKITNDRYFRKPVSSTFHGRDIFSPCAAQLSQKNIFNSLGPKLNHIRHLEIPSSKVHGNHVTGEIIYIDRFGNAISNIKASDVKERHSQVQVRNKNVLIKPYFGAGKEQELIAVWNSSFVLEFAVHNDSAEKLYGLKVGDAVQISL